MYSNDQTQIRQGLVSYIGAMVKSSPFEGKAARQNVAAALIEEALNIAKEDMSYDTYVLKPLYRATSIALKDRVNDLSKIPSHEAKEKVKQYEDIIKSLKLITEGGAK